MHDALRAKVTRSEQSIDLLLVVVVRFKVVVTALDEVVLAEVRDVKAVPLLLRELGLTNQSFTQLLMLKLLAPGGLRGTNILPL